ncbi:alcohol dehydrogenase [Zoogloea ramigera]|uniref:Alcohol dehydrogenase n=1 Tax=Zoogloea ramigera TaxID=350 RepID=A0A4Y4CUJ1_ZOORA|nr:PQQ-binding-like beta-propeller repeat protein [Zoogloea ramigera]GEC95134.1 alcohol dehydrogenase [Zoogloea ramigera]
MRTPIRLLPALLSLALAPAFAADIDWPTYGLDLSNQRYATPSQINTGNVGKLTRAWAYQSGVKATFQSTPIMVDRTVYLSLPFNGVVALDAVTGKQLWRYEHPRKKDYPLCCGPANRGVAVADGKVFIGTVDARLVTLDAKTGKVLWDVEVADADSARQESVSTLTESDPLRKATIAGQSGVGIAMAPVVHKGKVLIGVTGVGYGLHLDSDRDGAPLGAVVGFAGNYGRPGFLAAFDVATGKRVWQFDTIAPSHWEGEFRRSTPDGVPLNRDIEKERADLPKYPDAARYGGGSAWSTPAIDTENGLLYFGTGNPSPQMDGTSRPGDNLYTVSLVCLDVATGKIRWHYQQVPHDQWGYDVASPAVLFDYPHQGKLVPAVGQAAKIGWYYIHNRLTGELLKKSDEFVEHHNTFTKPTPEGQVILPGVLGGINWSPTSVDAKKLVAYVPAIHWPVKYTKKVIPATSAKPAVLATAGNLVFMGEGSGRFNAYDAATGQTLWSDQLEAGVNAPPVTWQIDGVQYVGVAAGGNQIFGYKAGDTFQVYRLGN